MEAISSYVGCDVYAGGKVIGRVTDFFIDLKNKNIRGISCLSNTGIIRTKFFVEKSGILHLDRNGIVVNKQMIKYKKSFLEEYSGIVPQRDFFNGSMGDIYIEPDTLQNLSRYRDYLGPDELARQGAKGQVKGLFVQGVIAGAFYPLLPGVSSHDGMSFHPRFSISFHPRW